MKKIIIIYILLLAGFTSRAQQTIEQKGKLYNKITEKYQVLADSPRIKHGLYQAIYNKKTAVASGLYNMGKKTGIWHFYSKDGKVIQNYNYDKNTLAYEAPEDTTSAIRYVLDNAITEKDTVYKPVKAGGIFYGYLPYIKYFVPPLDLHEANPALFKVVIELFISPGGRLVYYKARVASPYYNYNKVADLDMDILTEEDKTFIPAKLNGEPVSCTIYIECNLMGGGKLEYK